MLVFPLGTLGFAEPPVCPHMAHIPHIKHLVTIRNYGLSDRVVMARGDVGGGEVTGEAGMTWTWTPPIMYIGVRNCQVLTPIFFHKLPKIPKIPKYYLHAID